MFLFVQEWQEKFYETLTRSWKEQRDWLTKVNERLDGDAILLRLFADVLDSVDPSLDFCLDASLKQRSDTLAYLQAVVASSDEFIKAIRKLEHAKDEHAVESFAAAVYRPFRKHVGNYATYLASFVENALKSEQRRTKGEEDEQTFGDYAASLYGSVCFFSERSSVLVRIVYSIDSFSTGEFKNNESQLKLWEIVMV